jgi:hypothetical protein
MTVIDMEESAAAQNLAQLRAMRKDEKHRKDWPDIERAIVYLTATSVRGA